MCSNIVSEEACADPENSITGWGTKTFFFLIINNVFHRGRYRPSLRNNCFSMGVRTRITNETYSPGGGGVHIPDPLWIRPLEVTLMASGDIQYEVSFSLWRMVKSSVEIS